jgi:signal transduction histidine kinase
MNNPLVSDDLNEKIRWYIRAHGHSSIGSLNLMWTYFSFSDNQRIADDVQKAIDSFEQFGFDKDLNKQQQLLQKHMHTVEKDIQQTEIEPEKKDEMQQMLQGVYRNIERIESIIDDPNYEEEFKLNDIYHSTLTELLKRYPNTFYGETLSLNESGDKIQIHFQVTGSEQSLHICGYDMQLLLFNIISNASDALIGKKKHGNIWIDFDYKKDHVAIHIADDAGISDEALKLLKSKKSFSTKGEKHGQGMKIIHDLLEKHSAKLSVKKKDERTIFSINIPYK